MNLICAERPSWLRKTIPSGGAATRTKDALRSAGVRTVCESGLCPNSNECYSTGQAAFLILGDACTRSCAFCAVPTGAESAVDSAEPFRLAEAVRRLGLRHAVITSVTRDDLEDGGAGQFAKTITAVRAASPKTTIEVLVPDFCGNEGAIKKVALARPDIFAHNMETVRRLYPGVRPEARYDRSLAVLAAAARINPRLTIKSGLMVGLGEAEDEVYSTMKDLRSVGCRILTIGQYLRPRAENIPVKRFVRPEEFEAYKKMGEETGLGYVMSGPFVRSSYMAEEAYKAVNYKL